MATRSLIFVKKENDYKGIYCHYDGYLDGVGETLLLNYQDEEKINNLIELGSISYLSENLPTKEMLSQLTFDDFPHGYTKPYSLRGEEVTSFTSTSKQKMFYHADNCGAEFVYYYEDGVWYYSTVYGDRRFRKVVV